MRARDPLSVDFAALKTLRLVYENRSFSKAADILGVNQSAVSYTIEKLRDVFDDPLFIRQGNEIVSSERCAGVVETAVKLLDQFDGLTAPVTFDPATAVHRFSIACNYYERQMIIPHVVQELRRTAPGVGLEIITSTSQGRQQLKRSEVDMLIGPIRPDEDGFYCRKLLQDHYVCVMDKASPLSTLDMETYIGSKHAIVDYGGNWQSGYLAQLASKGIELNRVLSVPSPAGLQSLIVGTDLMATVPLRIARSIGDAVRIVDCPCPAPFDIDLVWTSRTHHSPMHKWLRELISKQVAQNVEPVE